MKKSNYLLLLTAVSFIAISCSKATKTEISSKNFTDTGSVKKEVIDPIQKAEEMALAAEKLMTVNNFLQANALLEEALKLDSKNMRALYNKNILKPIMLFQGIVTRLQPITNSEHNSQDLANCSDSTQISSDLKRFLTDKGQQKDLSNEDSIKNFIKEYRKAVDEVHRFAQENQDNEILINNVDEFTANLENMDDLLQYNGAMQVHAILSTVYDSDMASAIAELVYGESTKLIKLAGVLNQKCKL